ncbi:MAG TPA: glycosyltransferase [Collinsella ihuae]|uniref:Glycosyltransferase n=1 Tax=Collinsella ihumii TaxID=1720204 RepID=A0A921ITF5_9ACTN|nr:glycosyltransferase [Collinsella ihumii]
MDIVYLLADLRRVGPTSQTLNIINNNRRFSPRVVTLFDEDPNDSMIAEYRERGIEVYSAGLSRKLFLFQKLAKIKNLLGDPETTLIHGNGVKPDIFSAYRLKPLGYRVCSTIRNVPTEDLPGRMNSVLGAVVARIHVRAFSNMDYRVACSNTIASRLNDDFSLTMTVIQNGVNTGRFGYNPSVRDVIRRSLGIDQTAFLFVTTNSFIPRKRQGDLIEAYISAFSDDSNVYLILLGEGDEVEKCRCAARGRKDILFLGKKDRVDRYLSASDCFVSGSSSEGLPNAVIEALDNGCNLILSDIPQHLEVAEEYPEWISVFKLGDTGLLASFMKNRAKRGNRERGFGPIRPGGVFSMERMASEYTNLYRDIEVKAF